jgi:hypothetical protein
LANIFPQTAFRTSHTQLTKKPSKTNIWKIGRLSPNDQYLPVTQLFYWLSAICVTNVSQHELKYEPLDDPNANADAEIAQETPDVSGETPISGNHFINQRYKKKCNE